MLVTGVLAGGAVASAHIATVPWHGTGWKMHVYGREGTLVASSKEMGRYGNIQLQGAQSDQTELGKLAVPDRLIQVPGEMPEWEPFNVGQMYQILARAIREGGAIGPDFDLAVERHGLLDVMQRSSESGQKLGVLWRPRHPYSSC